ncbi:MAG: alpha-mannosidase, partial [Anaerolineales bacterium]
TEYPADELQALWREVLLYQFHDILPGSSIKRVYDESLARYALMLEDVNNRISKYETNLGTLVDTSGMTKPVLVQNSLSWDRVAWCKVENSWIQANSPGMGYSVVEAQSNALPELQVAASPTHLENDLVSITFYKTGGITSVIDKRVSREVIAPDAVANQLLVFQDIGDAWDFALDYAEQLPRQLMLQSVVAGVDGPQAWIEQVYKLGQSTLTQKIILTANSPRLDFVTKVHWRETSAMLRVRFPVAVLSENANYEIQFGHITRPTHRNTTWDLAQDEVAAHKWVDISQRDYGVALLNDAKYGHKIKGNVIDLNLLRSVPYPGPHLIEDKDIAQGEAHHGYNDQTDHEFTYALYPHSGDHITGGVLQAGYELNVPLRVLAVEKGSGVLPRTYAFITIDAPHIIVESIKKAEDDNSIIIRIYEAANRGIEANVTFGLHVTRVEEVSLMEKIIKNITVLNNTVTLTWKPFEIKTLKISKQP